MSHTCHAKRCNKTCKPEHLMCSKHWRMVPRNVQRRVWATYQDGQERGDAPVTEDWHEAADAAIEAVAKKEGLI